MDPARLNSRFLKRGNAKAAGLMYLVGGGGFEPPTNGLKVRCSTD
jgi:hypothetical protein